MRRRKWLWTALLALPVAVAGLAYGQTLTQRPTEKPQAQTYTCPVTGEELPCPDCCPYNQQK